MDATQIQTGDNFLVYDPRSFISRTIVNVMKWWAKKKGYDKLPNYDPKLLFSHAATFNWIAGKLYVMGSIDGGYKPWLFEKHYDFDKDVYAIMRRKVPLTEEEKNNAMNYCMHLVTVSKLYQYWNFIQWLLLVYLNINTFRPTSDSFNYCYESTMMERQNLNPENYSNTCQTDLFQLLYDTTYDITYTHLL